MDQRMANRPSHLLKRYTANETTTFLSAEASNNEQVELSTSSVHAFNAVPLSCTYHFNSKQLKTRHSTPPRCRRLYGCPLPPIMTTVTTVKFVGYQTSTTVTRPIKSQLLQIMSATQASHDSTLVAVYLWLWMSPDHLYWKVTCPQVVTPLDTTYRIDCNWSSGTAHSDSHVFKPSGKWMTKNWTPNRLTGK
jgi:hypothetical protein